MKAPDLNVGATASGRALIVHQSFVLGAQMSINDLQEIQDVNSNRLKIV